MSSTPVYMPLNTTKKMDNNLKLFKSYVRNKNFEEADIIASKYGYAFTYEFIDSSWQVKFKDEITDTESTSSSDDSCETDTQDLSKMIKIAFIGAISSGKSTLINAIIKMFLAQCKISNCTMLPWHFQTQSGLVLSKKDQVRISKQIVEINEQVKTSPEKYIDSIVTHAVPSTGCEIVCTDGIPICLVDTAGTNDKDYRKHNRSYLRNNFHTFDIVVYVVDTKSGLNTSDELKTLKSIIENTKKVNDNYNRDVHIVVVCNKFDDENIPKEEDRKEQLNNIKSELEKQGVSFDVLTFSSKNTLMYRMIEDEDYISSLSQEEKDKLALKLIGETKFKRYKKKSVDEQNKEFQMEVMCEIVYLLEDTGYTIFVNYMNKLISSNYKTILYSKINCLTSETAFYDWYTYISELNNMFGAPYYIDELVKKFNQYMSYLIAKYDTSAIVDDSGLQMINEFETELNKLVTLDIQAECKSMINPYLAKIKQLVGDYQFVKLCGGIFELNTIICTLEKLNVGDGLARLMRELNILIKVPIQDYYIMVNWLVKHGFYSKQLLALYVKKFVSECNTSEYSGMIKTYLQKMYYSTDNIYYSYLASCLTDKVIDGEFNIEEFEKRKTELTQLLEFDNSN